MKVVSGKRICAAVERHGWKLARIAGSHHIYVKSGLNIRLTIPVHGNQDLKKGLQRAIMKMAGIEETDL